VEKQEKSEDPHTLSLEQKLSEKLGAQLSIKHNVKGKGKLVISYSSLDELDEIIERFN
jgi:ParB family chromosome partitioning protein